MMLNNKIALKLSLSFALALIIFSIIISGVFLVLFKQYTVDLHKMQLQKLCAIASTIIINR